MHVFFQYDAKNTEKWLKFFISYMVYSQIWLNLPRYHSHFFYIFLWMITTLAKDKNSLKKHCLTPANKEREWKEGPTKVDTSKQHSTKDEW
jgi:hypothetical protein